MLAEVGQLRELAGHLQARGLLTAKEQAAVVAAAVEAAHAVDVAAGPLRALALITSSAPDPVAGVPASRRKSEEEWMVARQLVKQVLPMEPAR